MKTRGNWYRTGYWTGGLSYVLKGIYRIVLPFALLAMAFSYLGIEDDNYRWWHIVLAMFFMVLWVGAYDEYKHSRKVLVVSWFVHLMEAIRGRVRISFDEKAIYFGKHQLLIEDITEVKEYFYEEYISEPSDGVPVEYYMLFRAIELKVNCSLDHLSEHFVEYQVKGTKIIDSSKFLPKKVRTIVIHYQAYWDDLNREEVEKETSIYWAAPMFMLYGFRRHRFAEALLKHLREKMN